MSGTKKRINISLDPEIAEALKQIARAGHTTISQLITQMTLAKIDAQRMRTTCVSRETEYLPEVGMTREQLEMVLYEEGNEETAIAMEAEDIPVDGRAIFV